MSETHVNIPQAYLDKLEEQNLQLLDKKKELLGSAVMMTAQNAQLLKDQKELTDYLRHCVFLMDAMRPKGSVGDELATMRQATALLARLSPQCGTCNGRGEVSGVMPDGSHQTDPCPSCRPSEQEQRP